VALAIGEALASAGRFESVDDVFYLRSEEMEQAVKDLPARTPTPDLRPLVAARRHERELQRSAAPPPRIGEVPAQVDNFMLNKFWGMPVGTDDAPIPGGQLKCIGASDGLVEGPAHVALSLEDLEGLAPGAILVVPATNPAWMHAFVRIAGIVTDQGGSLSHAAVVAREYRIPAVLGTQRATLDIQHGRIIRIDGTNGTVEILK
jgi:pyruvate,water dikinase